MDNFLKNSLFGSLMTNRATLWRPILQRKSILFAGLLNFLNKPLFLGWPIDYNNPVGGWVRRNVKKYAMSLWPPSLIWI